MTGVVEEPTGPDPNRDVVLQAGDRYEGVRITRIVRCSEALDDFWEIVMTVRSENAGIFSW